MIKIQSTQYALDIQERVAINTILYWTLIYESNLEQITSPPWTSFS